MPVQLRAQDTNESFETLHNLAKLRLSRSPCCLRTCLCLQDPNIKGMAEQIAQDPAFAQMSAALQASMGGSAAEANLAGGRGAPQIDPEQYASAMTGVLQNPQFMEMAEKLGQQIMQVPCSSHNEPSHMRRQIASQIFWQCCKAASLYCCQPAQSALRFWGFGCKSAGVALQLGLSKGLLLLKSSDLPAARS